MSNNTAVNNTRLHGVMTRGSLSACYKISKQMTKNSGSKRPAIVSIKSCVVANQFPTGINLETTSIYTNVALIPRCTQRHVRMYMFATSDRRYRTATMQ